MKDKELGQVKKQIESNRTLPLICAVQGYPAPLFRYMNRTIGLISEPSTSVAPKLKDGQYTGIKAAVRGGQMLMMSCMVQGYPVPLFRWGDFANFNEPPQRIQSNLLYLQFVFITFYLLFHRATLKNGT